MDRYLEEIERLNDYKKKLQEEKSILEEENKELIEKNNRKVKNDIKVLKLKNLVEELSNIIIEYEYKQKDLKKNSLLSSIFTSTGIVILIIASFISFNVINSALQLLALFFIVTGLSNGVKLPKIKQGIKLDIKKFNLLINEYDNKLSINDKNIIDKIELDIENILSSLILSEEECEQTVIFGDKQLKNMTESISVDQEINKIRDERKNVINDILANELEKGSFDNLINKEYVKKIGVRR